MHPQGKTALITGAARRIGREIALTLAASGFSIVIHYRRSRGEAESLAKEIRRLGVRAFPVRCDFSAAGPLVPRLRKFAADVKRAAGHVDVLVNNASVFYPTPFGKVTEHAFDDLVTVNLKTPFFLAQAFGAAMARKKRGKIINLGDWTGVRPSADFLPYCAAKAGLINLTAGLAKALAPHVQVVGIAPGPILPAAGMTKAGERKAASRTLLKRFGSPSDIAKAVRFFVEDTDFVTGSFLPVDGGALAA